MKPDSRQIKMLQEYLNKTLTYRETYEEVYDHILSALECQPGNIIFEDAINHIINNDFGGPENLLKIEKANKKALVKQSINTYVAYLGYYLKLPGLLYTLGMGLLSYYFFSQMQFGPKVIVGLFVPVVLYPALIWALRLYYTGYDLGTTQKSAKDKLFESLAGLPTRLCLAPLAIINLYHYKAWSSNYYFIAASFVLGIIYNLALYKFYRREFKTKALAQ
jgi:hypothetical protein